MMQKELLTKRDITTAGEEISHELATEFISSFQEANPGEVKWFCMGKNILEAILAQPGCTGIRFYNGINEKGQKTLVYIGMDADGKDLVKKVVVDENGSIATVPAIVADRNPTDWGWLKWLVGA